MLLERSNRSNSIAVLLHAQSHAAKLIHDLQEEGAVLQLTAKPFR
jgi:hypothetical protein